MVEVEIEFEEECDVRIDFSPYMDDEKIRIIKAIINDEVYIFEKILVGGTTVADIEPKERE
jgi:hypothetical protein